ncbi:MAG: HAD-IIB family hydrolase, partial [Fibrobacterota bacterium]
QIDHRIEVEEDILKESDLIVTSTEHEIKTQYGMYMNKDIPKYNVIPPGINIEKFYSFYHDSLSDFNKDEESIQARAYMIGELERFFSYPEKPLILALCRPDKKKNIGGLIKAYGEDKELQAIANLAIFAGIRKDITDKEEGERGVLTEMLLLMDKYDLYGKMAIPKKHDFVWAVPELYRITGEKHGVFVNVAHTEPFGLTLIEASGCGVPIVATNDGGPRDIIKNCKNGELVNPVDTKAITKAIKRILTDTEKWQEYSANGIKGVKKHYTWISHADKYLKKIDSLNKNGEKLGFTREIKSEPIGKKLTRLKSFIFTDIDNTLVGDEKAVKEFSEIIRKNRDRVGFGVATGRTVESAMEALKKNNIPEPDILISSVGSEIYYGNTRLRDKGWKSHISKKWDREKVRSILEKFDFLNIQEEDAQREFKLSYFMQFNKDRLPKIHNALIKNKCRYNLIYSHGKFLDILPYRASKGKAIRYISYKWGIPLEKTMVCGDSGNDEEMLRGETLGVVVGNYSSELEELRGLKNIYFAENDYAGGIVEGIKKYKMI